MYSLELKNVTKVIGKNLIIDDVSFKLEKGKIYGLVGANGSGKSTILKIIMGLYSSTGEVFINGNNLKRSYKEVLSCIGGIVDYVSFYDFLTAYENLRYFALIYEVPLNRVDDVMKLVGLVKDKKNVKNFSLGMKQRLGIAIALLKDPDILILDEPTNGLDPKGIVEFRELLLSLEDKTIIVSSHIISEIEKIASEILFIHNKKIYQKSIVSNNAKKSVKFSLTDYEKASRILNVPSLAEDKSVFMTDEEVIDSVNKLSKESVGVYRINDNNSLEEMLISMMGDDEK